MPRADLIRELALRISRIERPHPVRVAIDGVDASGKTTLADELAVPLEPLGPAGDRRHRRAVFDFRADTVITSSDDEAPDDAVLLFHGVFLLIPELRPYWDYTIFVTAPFEQPFSLSAVVT